MTYKLLHHESENYPVQIVIKEENGKRYFIPFDPNNTAYQKYLEWVAEGNEPIAADEPVEITI